MTQTLQRERAFARLGHGVLACVFALVCVPDAARAAATRTASLEDAAPIRGMTISTHRGGREWGDPEVMTATLEQVAAVGANWVAIHPYAGIRADGSVVVWHEDDAWLAEPVRVAREAGIKLLIKPHLAYWGSPFSWRGEITFEREEQWQRFFATYTDWIVRIARATKGADAFAVGTELDRTVHREQSWREVIASVREVTDKPLTYAANWTDFRKIPFWDALESIGIQAYFPLSNAERPSERELTDGWERLMQELGTFSQQQERPILFSELGYSRSWTAAKEPWLARTDEEAAEALQRACLRVALEAVERADFVLGSFLWKWFPEPRPVGRDFQMAAPGVREELRRAWQAEP